MRRNKNEGGKTLPCHKLTDEAVYFSGVKSAKNLMVQYEQKS